MNMLVFQKKFQEIFPDFPEQEECELLKTIRIPKNIMYLSNRLPMANYEVKVERKQANSFKLNRSINLKQ